LSYIRGAMKHAAEAALSASVFPIIARRRRSRETLILAYHNVAPTGSDLTGDRSLHLPQQRFAAQLDSLLMTHRIVPLGDALAPPADDSVRDTRPRIAITFDDAYAGALTAGIAELRARELPATVFVTPGFLGGRAFWWDVVANPDSGLDDGFRERALTSGHGLTDDILSLARKSGLSVHAMPVHACGATVKQLAVAMEFDGITLAAHTWSHPNLTSLADADLLAELTRPLEWLKPFGNRALPMISYPYGLADRRVMDASRDAGYVAGFMIDGGWTTRAPRDLFAIPRINVPAGVSRDGFILRTSGLIQR